MTAAAAVCAMGVTLMPSLLIEAELARGELVIANPLSVPGDRYYYWVVPQGATQRPSVGVFAAWLTAIAGRSPS